MDLLGVRPGMAVADIGAGAGYYAVRLSRRVGPGGRVVAQDVEPKYLEGLRRRVAREKLGNVALALGEPHDPRLPPRSVDLALLIHMYHEIAQPFGLLANLAPALRPGGRVAVLDVDGPIERHGTPRALLLCELAAAGYRISTSGASERQGIVSRLDVGTSGVDHRVVLAFLHAQSLDLRDGGAQVVGQQRGRLHSERMHIDIRAGLARLERHAQQLRPHRL